MAAILVAGLINVETTLRVDGFPIAYQPVRYPFFGVNSTVSGVGYNVARALRALGHEARLLSLIGDDAGGALVRAALQADALDGQRVLAELPATPQSVILYDGEGRRMINTDLKDVQDRDYPPEQFEAALEGCDLAALCNINFSRPFLARARERGIPIATDVHAIGDLDDAYNREYMAAATILFQSHEHLPCAPDEWIRRLFERYGTEIAVVGMGGAGALLGLRRDGSVRHVPAVSPRPVVSTIGAGDALFSAFVDGYARGLEPLAALRRAVVFAGYKIGTAGAAEGLLDAAGLDALVARLAGGGAAA